MLVVAIKTKVVEVIRNHTNRYKISVQGFNFVRLVLYKKGVLEAQRLVQIG